ncbi:MAG: DUF1415 domain-containing protein [Myxococcales bacterium]
MPTTQPSVQVIAETSDWIDRVVIGLGLCPFAKAVQTRQLVRYVVTDATTESELLAVLEAELEALAAADARLVDTTLLIHPHALADFLDYNDFLHDADDKLVELELEGELQIASFHPDYRFADAPTDDPANYSNRSPYPMLHLLREASVSRAVASFPDASSIYERNVATLRGLDPAALARLIKG